MPSGDSFTLADSDGVVEFMLDLGEPVRVGEVLARVYPPDRTGAAPAEYRAKLDGVLTARHFPGLVQAGDCLAVVGAEVDG
jgi:N-alpha-acetyl-L-2,4-diaminobutyrate deacetylase